MYLPDVLVATNVGKKKIIAKCLLNWKSYLGLDKIPLATLLSLANILQEEVTY